MNELRTLDPFALDPFDDTFRSLMRPWRMEMADAVPRIKVDLSEQDGSYAVKAEIPGVKKEDIHVEIDGNQVSISAEVRQDKEVKDGERVLRSERYFGQVSRSFQLAHDIDEAAASASFKDGVLALTLPKKTVAGGKRLTIS